MLNISDILRKARERAAAAGTARPLPAAAKKKKPASDGMPADRPNPGVRKPVEINTSKPLPRDNVSKTAAYKTALELARQIMSPYLRASDDLLRQTREVIEAFSRSLHSSDSPLLELFFEDYPSDRNYISYHTVNVCLLCLRLGVVLNYDEARLRKLGLAAFLHDIGLTKYEDMIGQARKLEPKEFQELKKHPLIGKDLAAKFAADIDFEIFDVIQQEHERIDGTGYPYGLKEPEISDYAKLVGLVDVYEALIHSRPHRSRLDFLDAMRVLLRQKQAFDHDYLKALINTVGIFPVGTIVELNTKETGIVLRQADKMPLRPLIMITHNAQRQNLDEHKRIDLATNFSVYIKGNAGLPHNS